MKKTSQTGSQLTDRHTHTDIHITHTHTYSIDYVLMQSVLIILDHLLALFKKKKHVCVTLDFRYELKVTPAAVAVLS